MGNDYSSTHGHLQHGGSLILSNTVTVACKLPAGVVLRVFEMIDHTEPVLGGGVRATKLSRETSRVTIKGTAVPFGKAPPGEGLGGYALTYGVDAALWEAWYHANQNSDLVRNKLIFAHEDSDKVSGAAKDLAENESGMEGVNPTSLPQQFRRKIETVVRK